MSTLALRKRRERTNSGRKNPSQTFEAPGGVYKPPYGKTRIFVSGHGQPGNAPSPTTVAGYNPPTPGNIANYNPPVPGDVAYNPVIPGNVSGYNPPTGQNLAGYNPVVPGTLAYYNPNEPGSPYTNPTTYTPGNYVPSTTNPGTYNAGNMSPGNYVPATQNQGTYNPGNLVPGNYVAGTTNPTNITPGTPVYHAAYRNVGTPQEGFVNQVQKFMGVYESFSTVGGWLADQTDNYTIRDEDPSAVPYSRYSNAWYPDANGEKTVRGATYVVNFYHYQVGGNTNPSFAYGVSYFPEVYGTNYPLHAGTQYVAYNDLGIGNWAYATNTWGPSPDIPDTFTYYANTYPGKSLVNYQVTSTQPGNPAYNPPTPVPGNVNPSYTNPTTGNPSSYVAGNYNQAYSNPPVGNPATYVPGNTNPAYTNPVSATPGNISYNPVKPGNAVYNPDVPGNGIYNPIVPGNPNYNPDIASTVKYNLASGGNPAGNANPIPGTVAYYNPGSGGNLAGYTPTNPGTTGYNPSTPGQIVYTVYGGAGAPAPTTYTSGYVAMNPSYNVNPSNGWTTFTNVERPPSFYVPGNQYYVPGNGGDAVYNPTVPGNAVYNPDIPGGAVYNPVIPATVVYNNASPGNANYNAPIPGNANYNTPTPGNAGVPFALMGLAFPGGAVGTPGGVVPRTLVDIRYTEEGIAIQVPPGAIVTIEET